MKRAANPRTPADAAVIAAALAVLERRLSEAPIVQSPQDVKDYLRLTVAETNPDREVFACLWLDSAHRVIELQTLFQGTLTQTAVYPREIVRAGLQRNAAAVVLCHNHPSGMCEPSRADEWLTTSIKAALNLVDVRLLDHVVVSHGGAVSMAERGLV